MTQEEIKTEIKRLEGLLNFSLDIDYVKWIKKRLEELDLEVK
jgi:hypothetical protein